MDPINQQKRALTKWYKLAAVTAATFALDNTAAMGGAYAYQLPQQISMSEDSTATLVSDLGNDTIQQQNDIRSCQPINAGELRNQMYQHYCMNQDLANDGQGQGLLYIQVCDAIKSLASFGRCSDGTIRNINGNWCLQTANTDGTGDISFGYCTLYPEIPKHMLWKWVDQGTIPDMYSMHQRRYTITNEASGLHLMSGDSDVTNMTNTFRIYMSKDNRILAHNSWFFRSAGKAMKTGQLMTNLNTCLHDLNLQYRYIFTQTCNEDNPASYWTYYENGEIQQNSSLKVMTSSSLDFPIIFLTPANYDYPFQGNDILQTHQFTSKWLSDDYDANRSWYVNTYFPSGENICLAQVQNGQTIVERCNFINEDLFQFIPGDWSPATASWGPADCNDDGSESFKLTSSTSYSGTISSTVTNSISNAMKAGIIFESDTLTTSVSTAIATSFTESVGTSDTFYGSCERNEDGTTFTGGCIYQLKTVNYNYENGLYFTWNSMYKKCNPTSKTPVCAPGYLCTDSSCTMCKEA